MTDDVIRRMEAQFYDLGVQLGHELARMILAAEQPQVGTGAKARRRAGTSARPPASKPKILPGLSGRRRRPGEAPPGCGRAGCDRPSRTRGYCQTHYVQWLKAGDGERKAG